MRSNAPARSTSRRRVEVQGVSPWGVWLLVDGTELCASFEPYPALRQASIEAPCRVELQHGVHLHWPDLDVDIEVEALLHPERYPLAYRP